jgi:hypothetical protein
MHEMDGKSRTVQVWQFSSLHVADAHAPAGSAWRRAVLPR